MTERHKNPVEESVEQFLAAPASRSETASLSARVPRELQIVLTQVSRELADKAPSRLYTAAQIAGIAATAYDKGDKERPEILGNVRAFGRYLQKYPDVTGFVVDGSMGNRRTYRPRWSRSPN